MYNAIFNSFSMFSIYIAFLISKDDVREKRRVGKKTNDTIIKQYLGSFPLFLLQGWTYALTVDREEQGDILLYFYIQKKRTPSTIATH